MKLIFLILGFSLNCFAGSVTIRDIQIPNPHEVVIETDSDMSHSATTMDWVRDIVQLTLNGATIYPAKMLHGDDGIVRKVFSYQYAPNVVRIRITVPESAESYKGKVKVVTNGKKVHIVFSESSGVREKVDTPLNAKEENILNRVLETKTAEEKTNVRVSTKSKKGIEKTVRLTNADEPASPLKSIFAMALIVGGLGLFLLYVKRKQGAIKNKSGATQKSNGSFLDRLIPSAMKNKKAFIEVLGQQSLGPKQSIVVVRVRGQQLVLGVTPESIQLISQVDEDSTMDEDVTEHLGKMFGAPVTAAPVVPKDPIGPFGQMLSQSTGEKAIQPNIRDQIRKRVENLKSL